MICGDVMRWFGVLRMAFAIKFSNGSGVFFTVVDFVVTVEMGGSRLVVEGVSGGLRRRGASVSEDEGM